MVHNNIYFHSGGFPAMNQFIGSIEEIISNKDDFSANPNFYGCSAGAGYALVCYLVFHGYVPIEVVERNTYAVFDKERPISMIVTSIYCDLMDEQIKYWPKNLYELVSGVLHIGVSTQCGFKWINKFESNYDIYNALMCGGTIVGFTSYESKIDGIVCLDGAYQFTYSYIPDDCLCIHIPQSYAALFIPPTIIRPYFVSQGRDKVRYNIKPQILPNDLFSTIFIDMMFTIHSQCIPDPKWDKHIRSVCLKK